MNINNIKLIPFLILAGNCSATTLSDGSGSFAPENGQNQYNSLLENSQENLNESKQVSDNRKVQYYIEKNGQRTKHFMSLNDETIYKKDIKWFTREKDHQEKINKRVICNVGTPKVRSHWDAEFRKKYQGTQLSQVVIPPVYNSSQPKSTHDEIQEETLNFEKWIKIADPNVVETLNYRYIEKSSVASWKDKNPEKKIPFNYYFWLKHYDDKITGKHCRLVACIAVWSLLVVGLESFLIVKAIQSPYEYSYTAILGGVVGLLSVLVPWVNIIDKSLKNRCCTRTEEYKIVVKEPHQCSKIAFCMVEKKFNDDKTHIIPHYTPCLFKCLASKVCLEIISWLLCIPLVSCCSKKGKDLPPLEIELYVDENSAATTELKVGGEVYTNKDSDIIN